MSRIGLDIDSTLHHYWDLLESVAERRFGISLPYESQHEWGIPELGIDVLVDDSPVNLAAARERGMLGATIVHPWNRLLVADDPGVVGAGDWVELRRRVEPLLAPSESARS